MAAQVMRAAPRNADAYTHRAGGFRIASDRKVRNQWIINAVALIPALAHTHPNPGTVDVGVAVVVPVISHLTLN